LEATTTAVVNPPAATTATVAYVAIFAAADGLPNGTAPPHAAAELVPDAHTHAYTFAARIDLDFVQQQRTPTPVHRQSDGLVGPGKL
jgi:hypothetical protein